MTLDPALHRLSIRHLVVGPADTVAVAMQYEGPAGDHRVPLVGVHRETAAPCGLLQGQARAVLRAMKNYCGSICFDPSGQIIAVSAPRGGIVTFWDVDAGRHLSSAQVSDGCGVAPGPRPGDRSWRAAGRVAWSSSTHSREQHDRSSSTVSKAPAGTTTCLP